MIDATQSNGNGQNSIDESTRFPPTQPNSRIRRILGTYWMIWVILGAIASQIILIGGAMSIQPWTDPEDIKSYSQLKEILDNIRKERAVPSPDFNPIKTQASSVGKNIATLMKAKANSDFPAKQHLLWAARDELPRMLNADLKTETQEEHDFEDRLRNVARLLGIK